MAKKASSSKSAKAPASKPGPKAKPIVREICFGIVGWTTAKDRTTALLVLPFARPEGSEIKRTLTAEFHAVYTELPADWESQLGSILQAYGEGRVIFGWSKFRAKEHALSNSEWNAFCKKWFGLPEAVTPIAYSVEQLHFYVDAIVKRGLVKICGNPVPPPTPAAPVPRKKKGAKGARRPKDEDPVDEHDDDEDLSDDDDEDDD